MRVRLGTVVGVVAALGFLVSCGGGDESIFGSGAGAGGGSGGSGTQSGSMSTGTGGAGGGGCADGDLDGVTVCAGDCDDADPTTFPGAPEVCGDNKDNACGNNPDPASVCMGIGTYVAGDVGDDNNPGTQMSPVRTINKGIQNAQTLGGGADVYVAQGHYTEKIVMVEGIDLLGGHDCTMTSCTWQRDPKMYDSAIFNTDVEGILAGPTLTRATRIDGFRIVAANGDVPNQAALHAILVDQGTPTISNNTITGGNVTGCSGGGWCGNEVVLLRGPSTDPAGALVQSNTITGGNSPHWSVGLAIGGQAGGEVRRNVIKGGTGDWSRGITAGGQAGPAVIIAGNEIFAGSCAGNGNTAFGVFIGGYVVVTFDNNRINADQSQVGACPGCNPMYWCGGLESEGGTATITNNVIFGTGDATRSTAVFMGDAESPIGSVALNGNVLNGVGSLGTGNAGVSAAIAFRSAAQMSINAVVGRIRNNILIPGRSLRRVALYEDDSPGGRTCKPEALDNNDFWFPPSSNPTMDTLWREWNGSMSSTLTMISQVNGHAVDNGNGTAANNLAIDPKIDGTWHLQAGSPCINAGTTAEAPMQDMDSEARPQGGAIDIGADEAG